ncbi:MAG TPA: tripartite tricarboxylate transporter substrate-binding protein [bacterium]|nr:tripartite tricarboxylate transporter substrate-binding protein [bacterium]
MRRINRMNGRTRAEAPAAALGMLCAVAVTAAVLSGAAGAAGDETGAAFYRDKTVTLIVATKPGGGYDAYGRLLARYMPKYLPGSTFVVRNVPGGGHIIGANEVYTAKPDGLTLGTFNKGLVVAQVAGVHGIRFDMTKFEWIGVPDSEPRAWIVSKPSPFKTLQDVTGGADTMTVAANGVGTEDYEDYVFLENIFDLKNLKIVTGYKGGDVDLAFLRGEVNGKVGTLSSVQSLIHNEGARVILLIGRTPLAEYPGVPALPQVAPKGREALINLMLTQAILGHPFAAPPGVPADRSEALRRAFEQALQDSDLRTAAAKAKLVVNPLDAQTTSRLVAQAAHPPADVAALIKRIMSTK